MKKIRTLISAGPTREYIDPVRFLTNASSGRMGWALAREALRRGHLVTLVSGPVERRAPKGVDVVRVVSALEMLEALRERLPQADLLIMAAAVADFRPSRRFADKPAKDEVGKYLRLIKNPDILRRLRNVSSRAVRVGFALETGVGLEKARRKLLAKGVHAIILNGPEAMESMRTAVLWVPAKGAPVGPWWGAKAAVARRIVAAAEALIPAPGGRRGKGRKSC